MNATKVEPLGLTGIHSVELCVHDAAPWLEYFVEGFGFQYTARSTPAYDKQRGCKTFLLQCGEIRLILMQPADSRSPEGRYLSAHPEGIRYVNFGVKDLERAERLLRERDAALLYDVVSEQAGSATFRHFGIATALGDVNYRLIHIDGSPDLVPGMERIAPFDADHNPLGITEIDHLTSNVRSLVPLIHFYEAVMGFERFWKVQFHTEDLKPGTGTGLRSVVVWDPDSKKVKLANNEPLGPRFAESQIQMYVEQNRGPGIQHIAFGVRDIVRTVEYCNGRGIEFLPTPRTYYELVPRRIQEQRMGRITHSLEDLERLSLLIDGVDGGYLVQIFCKDQAAQFKRSDAGPLFIEIIQRCGHNGFGEGNFRALFESIELEQKGLQTGQQAG